MSLRIFDWAKLGLFFPLAKVAIKGFAIYSHKNKNNETKKRKKI